MGFVIMENTMANKNKTWSMGNIALFGAILMSNGIVGKQKESLKKMMYQALNPTIHKQHVKQKSN